MSDRLVIGVSLLTVIAVRKIWLELFEETIFFISFHIFFRSLIFSWKKSAKIKFFTLILKAYVRYFFSKFYFSPRIALQKLWKMFFNSYKKLFSFSRYSNFCIFVFPFFSLSVITLDIDSRNILKFTTSSTA